MTARRLGYVPILLAALAATVAGCVAEPAPETPRTPRPAEVAEAPEVPAEPTEAPMSTVLPATCEELLPLVTAQTYDPRLEAHPGVDAEAQLAGMIGPMTMATLRGGEQQLYCNWGITGTGALAYLGAAVIDEAAKTELVAALRDSVCEEVAPDGAEARFTQGQSAAHQYVDQIIVDGDMLIAASNTITGDFAQDAWARIRR